MLSRNFALMIGLVIGGLIVGTWYRASRTTPCPGNARADAALGGGLPICLGRSTKQFAPYEARLRRDSATDDRYFTARDLLFWYEVSGGSKVRAACLQIVGPSDRDVDSIAAFRRSVEGGDWTRIASDTLGMTVTTWLRGDGRRQVISSLGIFCVRDGQTGDLAEH